MKKRIFYLHGFGSSSLSEKARQTTEYFRQQWPQIDFTALDIPYTPVEAIETIETAIGNDAPYALIGSSLGGFLATCIAERYGCRACLINPAVAPHNVLHQYLGEYEHPVLQRRYQVKAEHMSILQQLMPSELVTPQNYLVLLQSGDEVLDYRQAQAFYQGADIRVQAGGDHRFTGYTGYLPAIAGFCQLA